MKDDGMPTDAKIRAEQNRKIERAILIEEALREVIDETAFYQARFNSKEWRSKARAALAR